MKKWHVINENTPKTDEIIEYLLKARGITDKGSMDAFLKPIHPIQYAKNFPDELKKALLQAKKTILQAVNKNIPIVIHGDYDSDGICATTILYKCITDDLNYDKCHAFIPNRFEHGYGLSLKSINDIIQKLNNPPDILFVTVDSGITAVNEAEYIKSKGYDLIITDHHQKPDKLPSADVIVWSDQIVGAGIAWFLSKVLGSKNPQTIALAALATVTDLQPVLNLNRSIVKEGLKVMNSNPPLGIKKLLEVSGRGQGEITTYDLGWVIGPRLNASGRIVDALEAFQLMASDNEDEALNLALKLNKTNTERQDKTMEMYQVASGINEQEIPNLIFSAHADYHEGIIGLVAAKLVQTYYRPSIVISLAEEHGKGSVRSIPGIDIISLLRQFDDLFINLGGHPMAAGFTISKENIPVLQEKLKIYTDNNLSSDLFEPVLEIDLRIPLSDIDLNLVEQLNKLKPFGIGNREPVFTSEGVGVAGVNLVGRENCHLSLRLYFQNNYYKAIWFNCPENFRTLKAGDNIDIAYKIKESEYNGNKKIDLLIEDIKLSA